MKDIYWMYCASRFLIFVQRYYQLYPFVRNTGDGMEGEGTCNVCTLICSKSFSSKLGPWPILPSRPAIMDCMGHNLWRLRVSDPSLGFISFFCILEDCMARCCEMGLTHALLLEDSRLALTQVWPILIAVCCGLPLSLQFNADVAPCYILFVSVFTNQPIIQRGIGLPKVKKTLWSERRTK
jgi:hypothetical protein